MTNRRHQLVGLSITGLPCVLIQPLEYKKRLAVQIKTKLNKKNT